MESFLLILFASTTVLLLWKIFYIRKGIAALTSALKTTPLPDRDSLGSGTNQQFLDELTAAAIERISNVEVEKATYLERGKILDYVTNQIEDALLIVDVSLEIRYSNQAAQKLFPLEHSHVGLQLIEICFDHHIADTVTSALENRERTQSQVEFTKAKKVLLVEAAPFDNSPNGRQEAWVLLRDITSMVQTEQIRKDFVANASHELRTPLSIISGYLEMMEDEAEDDHTIGVLKKHTDRLTRIVEDMLTISKLENTEGQGLLNKEEFSLSECATGIVEQLQPLVLENQASINVKVSSNTNPNYFGDRFYFDQIFFNLIENALKQNPAPGLKVKVRIRQNAEDDGLLIEVIDNGVGIPAGDLDDIFKRFYRVDKHHSQARKGTGLGLSIVKRAVEAHNGTISVASQPGYRTTFRITLPATSDRTGTSAEPAREKVHTA